MLYRLTRFDLEFLPRVLLAVILMFVITGYAHSDVGMGKIALKKKADNKKTQTVKLEPIPYITHQLKVHFQILNDGTMALGIPRDVIPGDPEEAYEKLFLIYKSKAIRIDNLTTLCGRINVRTPQEALELCRLRTSPVTFYLWDKARMEVTTSDQIDMGLCFGNKERYTDLPSGYYAILKSHAECDRLKIKPTSVNATSQGFEVRRTLLAGDPLDIKRKYYLIQVRELVTSDGNYMIQNTSTQTAPEVPGVTWLIPFFM